ncbi:MAG: sle [Nocardioides sp.]|nr:sle [Nocardioides sp.]
MAVVLALVLAGTTGCGDGGDGTPTTGASDDTGTRPLTADEADVLAAVRVNNYRRELVAFTVDVPLETGLVSLTGRADMREHLAIAGGTSTPSAGGAPAYATFAWNLTTMAVTDTAAAPTQEQLALAAEVPTGRWQVHPLAGSSEALDQVALVLLNLALDRPDNAQLLRQNGAEYRGSTVVDGTDVTIMSATPSSAGQGLTYYVDDTARLVRVDVATGGPRPATVTFLDGDASSVDPVPAIEALGPPPEDEPQSETPG